MAIRRSGMMIDIGGSSSKSKLTPADSSILSRHEEDHDESVIPRDVLSAELEEELRQSRSRSRSPRGPAIVDGYSSSAAPVSSFPLPRAPQVRRVTFDDEVGGRSAQRSGSSSSYTHQQTRRSDALVPLRVQDPALRRMFAPSGNAAIEAAAPNFPSPGREPHQQQQPQSILRPSVVYPPSSVREQWDGFTSAQMHNYDALRLQPPQPRSRSRSSSPPQQYNHSNYHQHQRSSSAGSGGGGGYRANSANVVTTALSSHQQFVESAVQRIASLIAFLRRDVSSLDECIRIYESLRQLEVEVDPYQETRGRPSEPIIGTPEYDFCDAMLVALTSMLDFVAGGRYQPRTAVDRQRAEAFARELTAYRAQLLPSTTAPPQPLAMPQPQQYSPLRYSVPEVGLRQPPQAQFDSQMVPTEQGLNRSQQQFYSSPSLKQQPGMTNQPDAPQRTTASHPAPPPDVVRPTAQSGTMRPRGADADAAAAAMPPEQQQAAAVPPRRTTAASNPSGYRSAAASASAEESTSSHPPPQQPPQEELEERTQVQQPTAPPAAAELTQRAAAARMQQRPNPATAAMEMVVDRPPPPPPPPAPPQPAPIATQHSYNFFAGIDSQRQNNPQHGREGDEATGAEYFSSEIPRGGDRKISAMMQRKDHEIMCLRAALLKMHNKMGYSPSRSSSVARSDGSTVVQYSARQQAPPHVAGLPFRSIPLHVSSPISQQHGNLMVLDLEDRTFSSREWKKRYVLADDRGVVVFKDVEDYKKHSYHKAKLSLLFRQCDYFVPFFRSSASLHPQVGCSLYHQFATDEHANYFGFVVKQPVGADASTPANPVLLFKTESCQEHADWAHFLARCFNIRLYREMFPTLFVSDDAATPRRAPSPERAEATTQTTQTAQQQQRGEAAAAAATDDGSPLRDANVSIASSQPPPPPDSSPPAGALSEQQLVDAEVGSSDVADTPIAATEGVQWSIRRRSSLATNTSPIPTVHKGTQSDATVAEAAPAAVTAAQMVSTSVGPDEPSQPPTSGEQASEQPMVMPVITVQTATPTTILPPPPAAVSDDAARVAELEQAKRELEENLAAANGQIAASQREVNRLRSSLQAAQSSQSQISHANSRPLLVESQVQTAAAGDVSPHQLADTSSGIKRGGHSEDSSLLHSFACENCASSVSLLQGVIEERDALVRELNRQQEEYAKGVSAMCAKVLDDMDLIHGSYENEILAPGSTSTEVPVLAIQLTKASQRMISGGVAANGDSDSDSPPSAAYYEVSCAVDANSIHLVETRGDLQRGNDLRVAPTSALPSRRGWSFRDRSNGTRIQVDVQVVPVAVHSKQQGVRGGNRNGPSQRLVLRGPGVTQNWRPTQRRPVVPHTGY